MDWAAAANAAGAALEDAARGGGAERIRTANAIRALGCYWDRLYQLAACGPVLVAVPHGGGPAVAALSARGLHWRLVACCGYVPSLARAAR